MWIYFCNFDKLHVQTSGQGIQEQARQGFLALSHPHPLVILSSAPLSGFHIGSVVHSPRQTPGARGGKGQG